MRKIRIGSRESELAIRQSEILIKILHKYHKELEIELITMKTTGDKILNQSLDKIGGKGLFVKELDIALLKGKSDLSVHSLKDMPMITPKALPIVAFLKREDPRDVLVLPKGETQLQKELPIGCSSRRRMLQLEKIFPDAMFQGIRGNVLTRLDKLDRGEYGALVLAAAGLKRLGLEGRINRYFSVEEIIPAAGQGILAVQGRDNEDISFLEEAQCPDAEYAALCERAFVRFLDGGCSSPVAAYAAVKEDTILLTGLYYDEKSGKYITGKLIGNKSEAEMLGENLAKKLQEKWKESNEFIG